MATDTGAVLLAMSAAHTDAFLRAIFESVDLGAFDVVHHRDFDEDVAHSGRPDHDVVAICHQQDAFEIKLLTRINGKAVHFDGPPFDGTVLLAAAFNNCKSHFFLQSFTSPCACGVLTLVACERGSWGINVFRQTTTPESNRWGRSARYYTCSERKCQP